MALFYLESELAEKSIGESRGEGALKEVLGGLEMELKEKSIC